MDLCSYGHMADIENRIVYLVEPGSLSGLDGEVLD
jgi:hypothetical protein